MVKDRHTEEAMAARAHSGRSGVAATAAARKKNHYKK
jgi:hypothetical protein